ncbi:MAG: Fe(3+) ABC transporter substrate-binding protein [Rhodospirillales bacterium]|nr:Fe(3+) ABC transporter substrate-binding protein [Rhodospirillales bacterium]
MRTSSIRFWQTTTVAFAGAVAAFSIAPASAAEEVNLYSVRQPALIQPLLDAFSRESGVKVNVVFAESGMLERLKAEGANSPADAVLSTDVGTLHDMAEAGLLQGVKSDVLERNIPAAYRHPDGVWFGLTTRARVAYVSKDRVKPGELVNYADLADPKYKGKLCIRSGKHVYNVSLIASMIAHDGEAATKKWLEGVKANLAAKPQGSDRSQAQAIMQGACDISLANAYYLGLMSVDAVQKPWGEAVKPVFLNSQGRGTHVNVSGGAVTKSAKNRANAVKLLEFLSKDEAQKRYAEDNFEYPVKAGVAVHPFIAGLGQFKSDPISLAEVAKHRARATRLVDEVGFDQGGGA